MTKPAAIYLDSPQMYTSYYYIDQGEIGEIDDKDYVELRNRGQSSKKLKVSEYAEHVGFAFSADYVGDQTPGTLTQLKFYTTVIDDKHTALRNLAAEHPHRDAITAAYDKLLFEHNENERNVLKLAIANLKDHPESSDIWCAISARAEGLGVAQLTAVDRATYETYLRYDGMPDLVALDLVRQMSPSDLNETEMNFLTSGAASLYITVVGPLFTKTAVDLAMADFTNPEGWYQSRGTARGDSIEDFAYRNKTVALLLSNTKATTKNGDSFNFDMQVVEQQMRAFGFPLNIE